MIDTYDDNSLSLQQFTYVLVVPYSLLSSALWSASD